MRTPFLMPWVSWKGHGTTEKKIVFGQDHQPLFHNWFCKYKAKDFSEGTLSITRELAGLGCPPLPYYTNPKESMNSALRTKVDYTKQQWPKFPSQRFQEIKNELARPTTLTLYNFDAPTKIAADASAYGLGAVLLQQHSGVWKPVTLASRSMTVTENRYWQIKKEALAFVWACEKFSDYVISEVISLKTDHKPLVPLLSKTNPDCLPPCVFCFQIHLMRFDYSIKHVPSNHLYTADTLNRLPVIDTSYTHKSHYPQVSFHVSQMGIFWTFGTCCYIHERWHLKMTLPKYVFCTVAVAVVSAVVWPAP